LNFLERIASLNFKASGERDVLPPKKAPHPPPRGQLRVFENLSMVNVCHANGIKICM